MRKFFRHKHFVNLFALLALVLVLFSFSAPKVQDYNSTIEDEQKELRIRADGASDRVIRFSNGYGYTGHPSYYAEIAFSLGLFCSLVLTKRIIFSYDECLLQKQSFHSANSKLLKSANTQLLVRVL